MVTTPPPQPRARRQAPYLTFLSWWSRQRGRPRIGRLRSVHNSSQMDEEHAKLKYYGMDLIKGKVRDNMAAGVLEPAISKIKSLRFATEAAITILRIDDMIKLEPPQQQQQGY